MAAGTEGGGEELLAAVAGGNAAALSRLYDLYATRLLGFCMELAGDREEAETLVCATFHAVWMLGADLLPVEGSALASLRYLAFLCHYHPSVPARKLASSN